MNNKARSKEKSHALSSAYCFPPRMIYQLPTGAHNEVSPFSRFSSSPDSLRGCLGFRTKIHLGHACRLYNDPCCFFMHLSSTFLFDIYYDGNNNTRVDGSNRSEVSRFERSVIRYSRQPTFREGTRTQKEA